MDPNEAAPLSTTSPNSVPRLPSARTGLRAAVTAAAVDAGAVDDDGDAEGRGSGTSPDGTGAGRVRMPGTLSYASATAYPPPASRSTATTAMMTRFTHPSSHDGPPDEGDCFPQA